MVFRSSKSKDLRYPGKMVVFHVPIWNLPGWNLLGKALLAYAQTMPREDMLPPCSAVWVATLAQTKHFTFWKLRLQSSARWKVHWYLEEAPSAGVQALARAQSLEPFVGLTAAPGLALVLEPWAPCSPTPRMWLWVLPLTLPPIVSCSGFGAVLVFPLYSLS